MSFTRADDLLGAWRLESAVEVFDDGERRDEFGPSPEGYLCYHPVGIVSATLGDSARPPVPAGDPQSGTDSDRRVPASVQFREKVCSAQVEGRSRSVGSYAEPKTAAPSDRTGRQEPWLGPRPRRVSVP